MPRIALVGDYDPAVPAHQAIPLALQLAAKAESMQVEMAWLATDAIKDAATLQGFDAIWCVPASPYRSMNGALLAIRHAREHGLPFLGTCGGFQHAVLEYARNALGWTDAEHAETAPDAARAVIAPLACALVETEGEVRFSAGSRLAAAYAQAGAQEGYRCRYGLNPAFAEALTRGPLRATAFDEEGEVRGVELDHHPFFVATLFQPERAALRGICPPLARALLCAASANLA
ncbi:CTP synthase [uncultured Aquitalea sp.]|uniref:CTP synthase C-terminal region-related (seleno)protein n=1 Tax=uncultured Aquitalea sp. TaxID=540272 RepID=UPI0025DE849C|nr:CTP synthase [uncultured Aquitalea sp.]